MGAKLAWMHKDSSGDLHALAVQAYAHAKTGEAWPDTDEGNRLFRAWLASIIGTIANLGPSPIRATSPSEASPLAAYVLEPKPSSRDVAFDWQQALAYGVGALAWAGQGKTGGNPLELELAAPMGLATVDGGPPLKLDLGSTNLPGIGIVGTAGLSDTGILPAIPIVTGIVIVVVVGILAGATGWVASQISEVSSVGLQQKGKTTAAVQAMTSASEIVEAHQDREAKEQREIAYSQEELKLLQTLRETIATASGWQAPALRSVPDVRSATQNIGTGLSFGSAIFLALAGWAVVKYASK